jgi:hypothetical protein
MIIALSSPRCNTGHGRYVCKNWNSLENGNYDERQRKQYGQTPLHCKTPAQTLVADLCQPEYLRFLHGMHNVSLAGIS